MLTFAKYPCLIRILQRLCPQKHLSPQISEAQGLIFNLNFVVAPLACLLHTYPYEQTRAILVRVCTKPTGGEIPCVLKKASPLSN
jgi:hypothetical protein